jgi:hypothetical protein
LHLCRPLFTVLEDRTLLSFITAPTYSAGDHPSSVAVGDFNGDGVPDLAVANDTATGMVSILLGKGNGTFQAAQNYDTGSRASSAAVGDFNGDGHLDLAVANEANAVFSMPGNVSVLLGSGDGTFQAAQSYSVGSNPSSVAVGDFDSDGRLDLAITNTKSNTVDVLLGNGNGTFQATQSYLVGADPSSVVVADFDRDGTLDLAVADRAYGYLSVLLGKGDGTFQAAQTYSVYDHPDSLALGDFNGDGMPDVAVGNGSGGAVRVLLGKGDGTFQAPQGYDVLGSVAVGDFNGDGILDLAVAGSVVSILPGKGDGTFQAARSFGVGGGSVAVGDFDGDGHVDLAVANHGYTAAYVDIPGNVSVLLGKGDGSFQAAQNYASSTGPGSVAEGDLNYDGYLDLAVANAGTFPDYKGTVSILLSKGDGTFQVAQSYAVGPGPYSVAVGDFNGDGRLDLAVANTGTFPDYNGTVSILLGNGDGTFQDAQSYATGSDSSSVAVGDFNGDGVLDLAVANYGSYPDYKGSVSIFPGKGDGTFQAAQSYAVGSGASSVAVGDLNGDGHLDLVVANRYDGTVTILLGNGDGIFQAARNYGTVGYLPYSVAVGDFDGDGHLDLAVANSGRYDSGTVSVLLGNGDGTFQDARSYAAGFDFTSVAVGDFDGDGRLDLAVANYGSDTVSVLLGKGDGSFQDPQSYTAGYGSFPFVAVGDLNRDGIPDLAVTAGDGVTVLLNAADWGGGPAPAPPRGPALHRPVLNQPQTELVAALLVVSKPQAEHAFPPTFTDLQPNAVRQLPLEADTRTIIRTPVLTVRHAKDAVFEKWSDGVLDLLVWNLWS